jgi:NAD(P)-dependent dehydrogenase (short-subunit alcohol dehydrogenase family)
VVLTARREAPLRTAAETIGARYVVADSADETSFAAVAAAVGHIEVLVLSAGLLDGTFVRKDTVGTWDAVLRANLRSAYVATEAALPKMGPGGRIICISSTAARVPMKGLTGYSAAKAGLDGFAGALALEVMRDGIQVHVLSPGPVQTPMIEEPKIPMWVMVPDDVAHVVGFLTELRPEVVMPEIRFWGAMEGPYTAPRVGPRPKATA